MRRNLECWAHAATAAAKSLQSCPTLCNPIDGSPPGSPMPGILQARILEWVHFLLQCMKVKSESEVTQSYPTPSNPMDCSLERANWSFFASPLLPTEREEGVMLWAPASDIWQYQLPPTHPVPTFSTLPIDACSSKLTDHKRTAPTHCGSILGP